MGMSFNTQAEYAKFYDGLRGYAAVVAKDYFHDEGGLQDTIDRAMEAVEDWVLSGGKADSPTAYIKTIIRNSIKRSSKNRQYEAVDIKWNGMRGFRLAKRMLKCELNEIKRPRENEIMTLWVEGMRQVDIARKLDVSKQYVSWVVIKWTG